MFFLNFITTAEGNLMNLIQQLGNPMAGLQPLAGPGLNKLGTLTGALNTQINAGANTVSAMLDGYKQMETRNPNAPIVKAISAVEDIFTQSAPANWTDSASALSSPTPAPQFDPIKAFIGDGRETINLNQLISTVGGVGSGPSAGTNGVMSTLMGNQGAQNIISQGTNAMFGFMKNMQTEMGPGSNSGGRLLPGAIALAQNSVGNAARLGGRSSVPQIDPYMVNGNSAINSQIHANYDRNYNYNLPTAQPKANFIEHALNSNYNLPVQYSDAAKNQAIDYSPHDVDYTYTPYDAASDQQQFASAEEYQAQVLLQQAIQNAQRSVQPAQGQANPIQRATPMGGLGGLAGPLSGIGGLGGLGGLLGGLASGQAGGQEILSALPGKAMEVFSMAQAFSTGDTSSIANGMTGLISSAGNVLESVSNANNQAQANAAQATSGASGADFVIRPPDQNWNYTMQDALEAEYQQAILNGQAENAAASSPDVIMALPSERPPTPNLASQLNEAIMGPQARDVEALPAWFTALDGAYSSERRRLGAKLPSCYLMDRNLVGVMLTNQRAFSINNCQNLCQAASECKFFTFAPQIALCYLYDTVSGSTNNKHLISGPKTCPTGTNASLPDDANSSNDFMFGLVAPLQKFLGHKDGQLTPLQRLMYGSDGSNVVSSVLGGSQTNNGGSTYQMLGSKFADGFETGGASFLAKLPNTLGYLFGDPKKFEESLEPPAPALPSRTLQDAPAHAPMAAGYAHEPMAVGQAAPMRLPDPMRVEAFKAPEAPMAFGQAAPPMRVPMRAPQAPPMRMPEAFKVPEAVSPIIQPRQPVLPAGAMASPSQRVTGSRASSDVVDVFDTSSSVVKASSKFMDTVPLMDIAKAGFQLANSGFLKKNGIFGGNSTGNKMATLPPPAVGKPRAKCAWSGMQCCVPKESVPKKHKDKPLSLNGAGASRCHAMESFIAEGEKDELCVSIKYDDSAARCNTTKFGVTDQETGFEKTIYQATIEMPGKMNNGICECILIEDPNGTGSTIESNAEWEVNLVMMRETKAQEAAAADSADKLRKSATTAMAWTQMISNTAKNMGNAAFGTVMQPDEGVVQSEYNAAQMGEDTKWSQALSSLSAIKRSVNDSRGMIAAAARRLLQLS